MKKNSMQSMYESKESNFKNNKNKPINKWNI
jgi:hypothetical protein